MNIVDFIYNTIYGSIDNMLGEEPKIWFNVSYPQMCFLKTLSDQYVAPDFTFLGYRVNLKRTSEDYFELVMLYDMKKESYFIKGDWENNSGFWVKE